MAEKVVDKASSFYIDLFELEWKKLVLPVLMVLVLSASAYYTLDIKNSPQSEKMAELNVEAITNLSATFLRTDYFNSSVNKTNKQLTQDISDEINKREEELMNQGIRRKGRIAIIQKSDMFPFTPELTDNEGLSREDLVESIGLSIYRQNRFERLGDRLNSSENVSFEEFNDEVSKIRTSKFEDEEVQEFIRNYNFSEDSGAGFGSSELFNKESLRGEYQELSYISYLPSIIATFLIYYVINAVAVESARKGYRQIRNSRDEEDKDKTENEEKEDTEDESEDRGQKSEDKENSEDN